MPHVRKVGDAAAHKNQVSQKTFDQMIRALTKTRNGILRKDAGLLAVAIESGSTNKLQKQVLLFAKECEHLGLIDGNGNPK